MPDLVRFVNKVESRSISEVAYYKTTTKFVDDVLAGYGDTEIENIVVTGTSLGEYGVIGVYACVRGAGFGRPEGTQCQLLQGSHLSRVD
jgi:hypothetical protein